MNTIGNSTELRRGERMASLLMHLLSHQTRWYTTGALLESLGLEESERRNVQRDLQDLAGIEGSLITKRGSGTRLEWSANKDRTKGLLLPGAQDDFLNMILLERTAQRVPEMAPHLQGLFDIWRNSLPIDQRRLLDQFDSMLGSRIEFFGTPGELGEERNRHMLVFLKAIAEGRKVEVTYLGNLDDAPKTSVRVPAMLIVSQGQIYIGCVSQSNPNAEYYLRLSRVQKVKLSPEHVTIASERLNRLRERIKASGGMLGENSPKVEKVRLRFPGYFHNILREQSYHPSARVREVNGQLELVMEVEVNRSLEQWVLGWKERVEVIQPESLKKTMADFGKELVRRYTQVFNH